MDEDELEQPVDDDEPGERQDWPGIAPKQAAFLHAFVIGGGNVVQAARAARIARSCHYDWLKDPVYAESFKLAERQAGDVLESEAIRRAKEGVREPIYFRGSRVGYVLRYPEGTMQMLLRGAKPEKYREVKEHVGADGGPIQSAITVTFVRPSDS